MCYTQKNHLQLNESEHSYAYSASIEILYVGVSFLYQVHF